MQRRIPRAIIVGIGGLAACVGLYTLYLTAESTLDFVRLAARKPQAPGAGVTGLVLMGSVDLLAVVDFRIDNCRSICASGLGT